MDRVQIVDFDRPPRDRTEEGGWKKKKMRRAGFVGMHDRSDEG